MPGDEKLSKLEHLKENSRQLRGRIAEELADGSPEFSEESYQLLKHHGTYQQDDRDQRQAKNPDGTPAGKAFICMVRTRIPGGKLTAGQLLAELDLCDRLGNGTLRATSRQGLQLHSIVKKNLKETIRTINEVQLSTFCACGDVERNVMCCPAPYKHNTVRRQMQDMADRVAEHLKPRSTGYYDIWLRDEQTGEEFDATEFQPVEEPIYGARYLPRKFKTAFALPDDN
ncbi:MAG: NADPH-dependent assimilatory sulfite reductase hemoprotein subunit, partial [Planctomycetaceae bacterium]